MKSNHSPTLSHTWHASPVDFPSQEPSYRSFRVFVFVTFTPIMGILGFFQAVDGLLLHAGIRHVPETNTFSKYMGVSKNRGKIHQIIRFNRVLHYKPSILGVNSPLFLETSISRSWAKVTGKDGHQASTAGSTLALSDPILFLWSSIAT